MFYLVCDRLRSDHLRSIAIVRSDGNQSCAIRDRNASHNISSSLPRFNARVFECRNGLRYKCVYYRRRKDFNDKNKKVSYWDKIGLKIHLSVEEAETKFLQHKNCIRSLSNPKPMFSTVLELATTRLIMTNRRSKFACSKMSALPPCTLAMLFAFQPTRACIFDVFADQNVCGNSLFAIVCDCLRSAIYDRLRSYGNQPLWIAKGSVLFLDY